jgi:hypothetical protein
MPDPFMKFYCKLHDEATLAFSPTRTGPNTLPVYSKQDPNCTTLRSHVNEIVDDVAKRLDLVPMITQVLQGKMELEELREHIVQAYLANNCQKLFELQQTGERSRA